jgi:hypothetical protein
MAEERFPICTAIPPEMFGRRELLDGLVRELSKETPTHRSVVGPRYTGKSVLLRALAEQMRNPDSPYYAVIEWDLGHSTPMTDEGFLEMLCDKLGSGLIAAGSEDYGEYLRGLQEDYYNELANVVDSMTRDGIKILMIWDGFDKPLSSGNLTRNLWDNLRELSLNEGFRLVVASRRKLHDLIRDESSVTSDFWNIFGNIVQVGPLDDTDVSAILEAVPELVFDRGAITELRNWSGFNPPLLLSLINRVRADKEQGAVRSDDVNQAAVAIDDTTTPILKDLWSDCSIQAQDLFRELSGKKSRPLKELFSEHLYELNSKGFAIREGEKVRPSCRLLDRFVSKTEDDAGIIGRIAGTPEAYRENIREILARRLNQIDRYDDRLFRLIERSLEDIPDYPDQCLNSLTGIRDRVLELIWDAECGDDRRIPQEIVDYWSADPKRMDDRLLLRMRDTKDWTIPRSDPTSQLRLLQCLTGSTQGFESRARAANKDLYVLLNAVHGYRNRNQHADGEEIHLGVAVSAIMTSIELTVILAERVDTTE